MNITQAFRMAFSSIFGNKLRSLLTVLGVVIGVLAVVVLISVGQGASNSVSEQISGLGTNLLMVNVRSNRLVDIQLEELLALRYKDDIAEIAPILNGTVTAKRGTENMSTSVEATVPAYGDIRDVGVTQGRFLIDSDVENRLPVAVIGVENCDTLFGTRDVVGERISIEGREFTIVGVLEEKGTSMLGSEDDRVIIPFTTGQRLLRQKPIRSFYVNAQSDAQLTGAQQSVERFLNRKYGDEEDAYSVFNQSTLLDTFDSVMGSLTMMLAGIAAISLLVGGIGIMNIMLVTVSERTREIGIRKAIGAKRRDILIQFLIEAIVISAVGGILGLVLGYIAIVILEGFMGMALSMSPDVVRLALLFSAGVGILFGLYPANKASKLSPIQALRHE